MSEEGDKLTADPTPVPLRVTVCVLPATPPLLSVKISEALKVPVPGGVNVTLTAQVLLGATVAPEQVSALMAKSLAFAPLSAAVEITRLAAPLLVKVTCALDDAFTTTEPKFWLVPDRLTAGKPTNNPKGDKEVTCAVIVSFVQFTEPIRFVQLIPFAPLTPWKIEGPGGQG